MQTSTLKRQETSEQQASVIKINIFSYISNTQRRFVLLIHPVLYGGHHESSEQHLCRVVDEEGDAQVGQVLASQVDYLYHRYACVFNIRGVCVAFDFKVEKELSS